MEQLAGKILRDYGRKILLCRGLEKTEIFGFFQPDTGKVDRLMQLHPGPLGLENRNRYIYIGPADVELRQGDELEIDAKHYQVRSVQTVYGPRKPVYIWAMCVEKGGEMTWGKNG